MNIQDVFLNHARKNRTELTIFLVNGFQLKGYVTGFDAFTVVLNAEKKQNLIYKHAISTIIPEEEVPLLDLSRPEKNKHV